MSRWLIGIGVALVLFGLMWPWLARIGLGRLPGDIHIERDGFHFLFPLSSLGRLSFRTQVTANKTGI